MPVGYDRFEIVEHRSEIDAPYSLECLAVKIREDDIAAWTLHGWLRSQLPGSLHQLPEQPRPRPFRRHCRPRRHRTPRPFGRALLTNADALADQLKSGTVPFTADAAADALIREDPFAFLLAVISGMGIQAERAWALPYLMGTRLGYLQ
jgi:hypothetical protein